MFFGFHFDKGSMDITKDDVGGIQFRPYFSNGYSYT